MGRTIDIMMYRRWVFRSEVVFGRYVCRGWEETCSGVVLGWRSFQMGRGHCEKERKNINTRHCRSFVTKPHHVCLASSPMPRAPNE